MHDTKWYRATSDKEEFIFLKYYHVENNYVMHSPDECPDIKLPFWQNNMHDTNLYQATRHK